MHTVQYKVHYDNGIFTSTPAHRKENLLLIESILGLLYSRAENIDAKQHIKIWQSMNPPYSRE
ncbi:hypothetical protein MYVALT_G_01220 [Candidatus Vallotia tarda]|uniref:Uncharacterized protein n=1 Tax=Candidatus Vallotiella hemipterorum TaxID=1177213 RepID=A0A916NF58_9BURK|nr:hypothetical protein MYVALT_G_01220 [Candidatus Vallotia tarda]